MDKLQQSDLAEVAASQQSSLPTAHWDVDFNFDAATLRTIDIVPLLLDSAMQIQALHEHRQRLHTILAELCSNALEHGLLKLDSTLKQSADGFTEYYELRGQRLAELKDGFINVSLSYCLETEGGKLMIKITDSGDGFDCQHQAKKIGNDMSLYGRGESLLDKLCHEFYYSAAGNIAHAVYRWSTA